MLYFNMQVMLKLAKTKNYFDIDNGSILLLRNVSAAAYLLYNPHRFLFADDHVVPGDCGCAPSRLQETLQAAIQTDPLVVPVPSLLDKK